MTCGGGGGDDGRAFGTSRAREGLPSRGHGRHPAGLGSLASSALTRPAMSLRLRALVAVGAGSVGACSLAYSYDGLTDGPALDAGTIDAGDANGDRPITLACPPGAVLCEDFERGFRSDVWQSQQRTGGASEPDAIHARSGRASLHSHSQEVSSGRPNETFIDTAWVYASATIPTTLYHRVFVHLPSAPTIGDNEPSFLSLFEDRGGVELGFRSGRLAMIVFDPAQATAKVASTPFPTDTWVCVEWQTTSGQGAHQAVWVDGRAIDELAGPVVLLRPNVIKVGLNFNKLSAQPSFDVWFDDLIVDVERIGCER